MKPSFFSNVDLAELSPFHRLLFAGLWCWADREGRLEDRPKQIKGNIFPFDDELDVDMMLSELQEHGFVIRYVAEGQSVIEIPNFDKHQNPHPKEADSDLPPRKEISFRGKQKVSLLSSVSFPSVTSPLSPDNADPGETLQLDLEDSITEFIPNAYRRNGRQRPKLNRRQDQPLVERLESAEQKHGAELFRECLLNYLAQDFEWLRTNGWPLNRFLQDPESYAGQTRPSRKSDAAQRVNGHCEAVDTSPLAIEAPKVAQRDFLAEWNAAVPDAETEFEPRNRDAITPEFVAAFDKICEVARGIRKQKPDSTWLTFYWLLATKEGHSRPNWKRLITDMRGMAAPKYPESGQTTDDEEAGYQRWIKGGVNAPTKAHLGRWVLRQSAEMMAEGAEEQAV